jgi:hypothetical protein
MTSLFSREAETPSFFPLTQAHWQLLGQEAFVAAQRLPKSNVLQHLETDGEESS